MANKNAEYEEGFEAGMEYTISAVNPYPKGSTKWFWFEDGWNDAMKGQEDLYEDYED